jgi:hypothetical protein
VYGLPNCRGRVSSSLVQSINKRDTLFCECEYSEELAFLAAMILGDPMPAGNTADAQAYPDRALDLGKERQNANKSENLTNGE